MTGPYREWSREQLEMEVADHARKLKWERRNFFKLGMIAGAIAAGLLLAGVAFCVEVAGDGDEAEAVYVGAEQRCKAFCGPEHYVSVEPETGICRCSSDTHDEHRVYEHDMADSFQSHDRGLYEQCRRFCGGSYMDVDYENERCLCVDYIGQRSDVRVVRAYPLGELDPCFGPGVSMVGRDHP